MSSERDIKLFGRDIMLFEQDDKLCKQDIKSFEQHILSRRNKLKNKTRMSSPGFRNNLIASFVFKY